MEQPHDDPLAEFLRTYSGTTLYIAAIFTASIILQIALGVFR